MPPATPRNAAAYVSVRDELRDDRLRERVDRHRQPETLTETGSGHRGVDADHVGVRVGEGATRVARVQRGIGLDDVVDETGVLARARGQRSPEPADDARRHRAREPERTSDRDDQLADLQLGGVAQRRGLERPATERVAAHDRKVRQRVAADDGERADATVGERSRPAIAGGNDVRGGEHQAVGGDDDGRARTAGTRLTSPSRDRQAGDRPQESPGHGRDDARVLVERFGRSRRGVVHGCNDVIVATRRPVLATSATVWSP